MAEITDRARLVTSIDGPGVTATVARSEVLEALTAWDEPPELILDVVQGDDGGEVETLRFAWDPDELQQLLRSSPGDEVTFLIEQAALERAAAANADVQLHGFRERAVVLTVAAVTAAAAAPSATAGGSASPRAAHAAPPRGVKHAAEGTGFIPTPGIGRTPPPRGPSYPAEGTGFVPTPGSAGGSASTVFDSGGAVIGGLGGAALLIAAARFVGRGKRRPATLKPA
jgi:hypothetical protein